MDFNIPTAATRLREIPRELLDLRCDEDIITQLNTFQPIVSEKNVWAFWDKGIDAMYPSYKCTVLNWVRRLGPSWTVRVVNLCKDSPNNIYNYVGQEWFPECFVNKTMDGGHAAQHAADLVRLPLVYEYGGVWMDVGNMLHTHLDTLFWDALQHQDSSYEMGAWIISGQIRKQWGSFGNFMFAARKRCTFIKNWHDGYKALWKGRTKADGFHALPLIQDIGLAEGMADWDFQDKIKEMSDYVAQMLIGDRTRNLLDVESGWNGQEFYKRRVFMVEGINNGILGAIATGFDGQKQADLFATPLDDPNLEKRNAAERFVVDMLENSHMYKVYHNSAGGAPALGDLVKQTAFQDVDHRPGTFGEMYRYGTVHWQSTRPVEQLEQQLEDEPLIKASPTEATSHSK